MKQFLRSLAVHCSLTFLPASAQTPAEQVSLESLHKQLIAVVENEIANNKELDMVYASRLKYMVPVWREIPNRTSVEGRLQQLSSFLNQSNASKKTKEEANVSIQKIVELMENQSRQMAEDIRKTTGESLRSLLKTTDPDEIRKVISAYKEYRLKMSNGGYRDESATSAETSSVSQFMDYWLGFHNYRVSEQIRYAAGQITQMEAISTRVSSLITIDEMLHSLQNLRKSIGMLPPKELEALWNQTLQELLDDANQDRIDELMQRINKHYQICQASESTESYASRWHWLDILGRKLKECIQRGREGAMPSFSAEDLTRNDSSYGVLMKPEELTGRLNKYLIRRRDDKGNTISVRLFYDAAELKTATDAMLARILDDAHQDRLLEFQEEIQRLRSYASASRYANASNLSSKLERLSQLARSIKDNVAMLKMGGNNQLNLSQLYNDYSEGVELLSKEDLLAKLKRYQVHVQGKDGASIKRALYVDAEELLQQAKSCNELPVIVPEIQRALSNAMNESGALPLAGFMPRITRCADIAQQLSTGETFLLAVSSSSNYHGSDSSRSTPASGPVVDRIKQWENEVEWAVILRFFPGEASNNAVDHETRIKSLMAKFREQKNYEAMSQLNAVSLSFRPTRQLLSQTQVQAIRDYLNGIRQQEVFDQPRLAVYYLQKATISNATVIDAQQLKTRLQALRSQHPKDYEKGIDDALKAPAHEAFPREIEIPARTKS